MISDTPSNLDRRLLLNLILKRLTLYVLHGDPELFELGVGLDWLGLAWIGLDWLGVTWSGLVWLWVGVVGFG